MANSMEKKVWIIRKGNGALRVHPSEPSLLRSGERLLIRNLAGSSATIRFVDERAPVDPRSVEVPSGEEIPITVDSGAAPGYFEYEVSVSREGRREYAEAGSSPAMIIDG